MLLVIVYLAAHSMQKRMHFSPNKWLTKHQNAVKTIEEQMAGDIEPDTFRMPRSLRGYKYELYDNRLYILEGRTVYTAWGMCISDSDTAPPEPDDKSFTITKWGEAEGNWHRWSIRSSEGTVIDTIGPPFFNTQQNTSTDNSNL